MEKIPFIFILLLLFSCENRGSKKSEPIQTKINKLTEFEFSEEMHNFGSLQSGEIVIYTFEFKNIGNSNLIVNSIDSDCGCIKAEFSQKPVPPGGSGRIEIEFDSSGLWGKQFKSIEIHANTEKPKQLAIFAEVQNEELEIIY